MDGERQEVGLVSGRNILPKLVLKEKKFNAFGHKFKNMTKEELQAKVSIQIDIISKANYQIYKDVTEYIEGLPYKVDDKISCDRFSVCWISSITPMNIAGPTIIFKIAVNPAKKDGTRSNEVFVLDGWERDSIKKIN